MIVVDTARPNTAVASTQVAILGGGIAGAWLGYRLAQQAVPTVLIASDVPPVSRRWAAAVIDVRLLDETAAPRATPPRTSSAGSACPHTGASSAASTTG